MNDQAANRMLKTLEEPPAFVHLLLLTDRREDVLPTIASRCQQVRFDPLPRGAIAERPRRRRATSARTPARGWRSATRGRAARLASEEGSALRATRRGVRARGARGHDRQSARGSALLELAKAAGAARRRGAQERLASGARAGAEQGAQTLRARSARGAPARRAARAHAARSTSRSRLAELWLRDVLCVCEGARELVYAVDRRAELAAGRARSRAGARCARRSSWSATRACASRCNVSEELALEALAYRLQALLKRVS